MGLSQLQSDLDSGLLFCGLGTGPHTCGLEAGLITLDSDLFDPVSAAAQSHFLDW